MTLKKIQATTIFQPIVVATREAFSKLNVLPKFSPICLLDLFYATSDGFTSEVS
jgi:hypothetical protein